VAKLVVPVAKLVVPVEPKHRWGRTM